MKKVHLQIYSAIIWLGLTGTMILWWMYFAVGLLEKSPFHEPRHRQMLYSEGATLLILLLLGGATLIYLILHENKRRDLLSQFFSAFSHDIKTSLASLRLQVEGLREETLPTTANKTLSRLLGDTSRLQLQVENSLYLGRERKPTLFIEDIEMAYVIEALKDSWPQIAVGFEGHAVLKADRRALDSIFNNLVHNSIIHARATRIQISVSASKPGLVKVVVTDNGSGFQGPEKSLGQMHFRQNPSSGSGLGLFIVRQLVKAMGGQVNFRNDASGSGFAVEFDIAGEVGERP